MSNQNANLKYQYVIIQTEADYYELLTKKSVLKKDVVSATGLFDVKAGILRNALYKIYRFNRCKHWYGLNRLLLPFFYHRKIDGNKPVCFIIWAQYANDVKAFWGSILRKMYPGCKLVCRFQDVIEKMPYKNIDDYKDAFDLLQTFDSKEASKYNIDYFPFWYDYIDNIDIGEKSDVLFVGRAKDRLNEILSLYKRLYEKSVNCKFYLVGVPKDKQINVGNVVYGDYLSYSKVLELVKGTKCMVEILQHNTESETLRVFEAIMYNKKLITNNKYLMSKDYYSPDKIQIFNSVDDISIEFIKDNINFISYEKKHIERLKPIHLLRHIDLYLTEN